MKTSDNGRKFIEGYEGCFLKAYDDANDHILATGERAQGTPTIGFGHTTAAGPPVVYAGQTITREEADAILAADLEKVEASVNSVVNVPLNQNQFDALVSFQFNTGWLTHKYCSLLAALNSGNYKAAAQDFLMYDRAGGVVVLGLVRRRQAEKKLFETPIMEAITQ